MTITKAGLLSEVSFRMSRSGGKGGQNVNKVSTRVQILFNITASAYFNADEKERLISKLGSRTNKDGLLQIICDEERSQYLNKEIALERLLHLLDKALQQPRLRKKTKVSKAAVANRLDNKRQQAAKKELRRRGFDAD